MSATSGYVCASFKAEYGGVHEPEFLLAILWIRGVICGAIKIDDTAL